jgi:5-methylcytosine-specific restriction endonuclease McrA
MCDGISMKRCKVCYNEYMRRYMLERYHRRRAAIVKSMGGECAQCYSTEDLEIDHIDRSTKSFDIGKAIAGWKMDRINAELDKCQLLCHDCHLEKSVAENSVEPAKLRA